jgi:hypothetical protein
MQFSKLLVFFFALSFSTAAISEDTDTFTLDASQFNLGMVGFVGRVSKAEAAMVDIGKRKNAGSIFFSVIEDENRGVVAKLYALCGLKGIRSALFGRAFERMKSTEGTVSVMRGDVMTKEGVNDLVNQIKNGLC